jgi:hypothetical protein
MPSKKPVLMPEMIIGNINEYTFYPVCPSHIVDLVPGYQLIRSEELVKR